MKGLSATFSTIGVLCILMTIFTVFEISPAFLESGMGIGEVMVTAIFWIVLSILMLLTGIAFGVLNREL
ncbi:MAG: hypothetical protein PHE15_05450 [Dehalococcoidales bacterium]|jgi:hypothetical protein|nr:hypothetical protein [Dehalococcoidales bacterium]